MKNLYWLKLEATSQDEYGPIYVYLNPEYIEGVTRYKSVTNIYTISGGHYIVKEAPTEIFTNIYKLITGNEME